MSTSPLLSRDFFARDALHVAQALIGVILKGPGVSLRITETEAYRATGDSANHCRSGKTPRNAPMWGPPGRAYVYLCYGIHHMFNLVTDQDGQGAAVLIRACEPLDGLALIEERRTQRGRTPKGPQLLNGPGKVAQALALDRSFNHHDLCTPGGLQAHPSRCRSELLAGPRIGIGYAAPEHIAAPWRFADANSAWVSHRKALTERLSLSQQPR